MTLLTDIKPIQPLVIGEISQSVLVLGTTVRTLKTLKEPFGVASRAQKPSCPAFLIQKREGSITAANGAIAAPPEFLVYKLARCFQIAHQERTTKSAEH